MPTFKHSPEPWHVGVSIDKTFGEPWPVFRLRDMENIDPSGEEVQANRALIEAAPDLLKAVLAWQEVSQLLDVSASLLATPTGERTLADARLRSFAVLDTLKSSRT